MLSCTIGRFLLFLALCLVESTARQRVLAGELGREANSTLALPLEPHRYTTLDAFPGLTFDNATALVSPPGDSNRLFIVEQSGRIQVITNLNSPNKTLFLDISGRVISRGEGGLLGLAFHPGHPTNGSFFLFYTLDTTTAAGAGFHDRLARFEISPTDPNQALPDSEVPLITQLDEDVEHHNAGDLHFGPDGFLYVSLGDEGGADGDYGNTQRIDKDFFSGILRIDVDQRAGSLPPNPHPASSTNYTVPADNPFVGATSFNLGTVDPNQVRTEFWAVGLRNPWRFCFDSPTGRLYCGDVGQGRREEIDLIVRGGNYGWNYREGSGPSYIASPPDGVTFDEPILDYGRDSGGCVIGGVVYRGSKIPSLFGEYIFGDFVSGSIWALHFDGGTNATNFRQLTSQSDVRAFGQDPGTQDILMISGSGTIYRLVPQDDVEKPLPATLDATGAFADLATLQPQPGIVPYDVNVPFWSDYARKTRWFSVPDTGQFMGFSPNENWSFPTGTIWIKHFELELTNGVPQSARRLETRFLVRNSGGVYGITYRWDDAQANAFLVPTEGMDEAFLIHDGATIRTQVWHYPARAECSSCHTRPAGFALGFNTGQLNRDHGYGGTLTNQILALSQMGYFSNSVTAIDGLLSYASASDETVPVEHRVRSYLAANCVQCHQPGGSGRGYWDARFTTPLPNAGIINGALIESQANPEAKVIKPGSLEDSVLFKRVSELGSLHMPPLATTELNHEAIDLLTRWITNERNAEIQSITLDFDGQVRILFTGFGGRLYRVEGSNDLLTWGTLGTVQADTNGIGEFVQARSGSENFSAHFYRFAWP